MTEPVGDLAPEASDAKPYLDAKVYDRLKATALIWLPVLMTVWAALGAVSELPAEQQVLGVLAALNLALGGVVKASKTRFNADPGNYAGILTVEPVPDEGVTNVMTSVNREALADALDRGQTEVRLKVKDRT